MHVDRPIQLLYMLLVTEAWRTDAVLLLSLVIRLSANYTIFTVSAHTKTWPWLLSIVADMNKTCKLLYLLKYQQYQCRLEKLIPSTLIQFETVAHKIVRMRCDLDQQDCRMPPTHRFWENINVFASRLSKLTYTQPNVRFNKRFYV